MTAKQKAIELFNKFNKIKMSVSVPLQKKRANQCALIAVNEILKVTPMYIGNLNPLWKFWEDVKNELIIFK